MSQKTVKIPQGQIKILFENNGQSFEITDKVLWTALCDNMFKGIEEETPKEQDKFDDENPDYIRSSQEEI
jgi:hypothetical protein